MSTLSLILLSSGITLVSAREAKLITTETETATVNGIWFCYTTDKKLGSLSAVKQCGGRRKKRSGEPAIDVHGIEGLTEENLRSMIAPSRSLERTEKTESAVALPSTASDFWGGGGWRRDGRFLYAVTKTETKKVYKYTTTTSITFKCTPAISVLPECDSGSGELIELFWRLCDITSDCVGYLDF